MTVTIGYMWKISLRHTVYNMTKFIISKVVNFAPVYAMTSCSCIYNLTTTSYSSVRWKYFEIVLTVFTLNPCSDNTDFRPLSLPLSNANFKCFKHSPQFANFLAIGLLIIADLVKGLKESASSVALKGKISFSEYSRWSSRRKRLDTSAHASWASYSEPTNSFTRVCCLWLPNSVFLNFLLANLRVSMQPIM